MSLDDHSSVRKSTDTVAGFPALAIERIYGAQAINRVTILLVTLAIATFVIFGTIASLKAYHGNVWLYRLFHYVPYLLVATAIPFILYQAFIVGRYRLSQSSMLWISVGGASLLLIVCLLFSLEDWLWLAMAAWIGVTYWFKATFKRFDTYIVNQKADAS